MKKITLIILITVIVAGILTYIFYVQIPKNKTMTPNGKISIAASFYPMYYFATAIAGDKADVINITPAGAEPHDYEPTAQEIVKIEKSNLLILNGGGLEAWGDRIKNDLSGNHTAVVIAGKDIINKQLIEGGKTILDPHVWLSPPLAKEEIKNILKDLIQVDPLQSSFYTSNAKALENKIDVLDATYAAGLKSCARRDFVTSHAAFGYLADRYDLNQIAITGVSPDEEPSTAKLAEIADFVRRKGIKYIFFESLVNPKLSETIARETGAKTLVLDPIEGLSDTNIASGKDYFTEMNANLQNLALALQCPNKL